MSAHTNSKGSSNFNYEDQDSYIVIPVPTMIPQRTYDHVVLVEDVNKVEEASKEEIVTPVILLLEQPMIRTGKRTGTKEKLWNMGHANFPKHGDLGHEF